MNPYEEQEDMWQATGAYDVPGGESDSQALYAAGGAGAVPRLTVETACEYLRRIGVLR